MCRPFFDRPFFHLMCNDVCCLYIQFCTFFDRLFQLLVHLFRETLLHHCVIENIFPKNIRYIE